MQQLCLGRLFRDIWLEFEEGGWVEELEALPSVGDDQVTWGLAWALPPIDYVPRAEQAIIKGLL